ncbi:MAG: hypothetical protein JXA71_08190, partial [Chitinispirillaceae bacterium]|nr:hypothetical protein [Chitinispirillaceae bacterium]
ILWSFCQIEKGLNSLQLMPERSVITELSNRIWIGMCPLLVPTAGHPSGLLFSIYNRQCFDHAQHRSTFYNYLDRHAPRLIHQHKILDRRAPFIGINYWSSIPVQFQRQRLR